MVIAIDGPAGAGKSSVAKALAGELGYAFLDSGAMYRAVGLAALERGLLEDEEERLGLGALARSLRIRVGERVTMDGRDVTEAIRTPSVSQAASRVSVDPEVRSALVEHQRELLEHGDWVAEGRDIGTVVAPGAELKVFLTADPHERARRRAAERGEDQRAVLDEQRLRDERDSIREQSPLREAPDAVVLDTTGLDLVEVVQRIAALARERAAAQRD